MTTEDTVEFMMKRWEEQIDGVIQPRTTKGAQIASEIWVAADEAIKACRKLREEAERLRREAGDLKMKLKRSEEYGRNVCDGAEGQRVLHEEMIDGLERQALRMSNLIDYQAEDIRRMSSDGAHGAGSGLMPSEWYR